MIFAEKQEKNIMIHFYNGDGKGKTSAAAGAAIRMVGQSGKVLFAQFLKGNITGEVEILNGISNVDIIRNKKNYGFVSKMSSDMRKELMAEQNGNLEIIEEAIRSKKYNLVVMDEIGDAILHEVADSDKVKKIIQSAKEYEVELIMTGHKDVDFIIEESDYHTYFIKKKHPFDKGVRARKGVEF